MATADREATDREREAARGPSSAALPNARLNPLLNPLLAKQLGRWAHIYYTASVDKREAAVDAVASGTANNDWDGDARGKTPRSNLWLAVYRRRDAS